MSTINKIKVRGKVWYHYRTFLSSSPSWANGAIVPFVEYRSEEGYYLEFPRWFATDKKSLYSYIYRHEKHALRKEVCE